jgi:hypothetical protein
LNHADILHLEKHSTLLFRALNRKTRLEQFQLAGPVFGNSQNILLLATGMSRLDGNYRMVILPGLGLCRIRNPQIVSFETEQTRIRFGSRIGAGDLRSRDLHAEPYVQLHLTKNRRPAYSAPYFARLARFCFNWRRPSPKNLKSSCSPRHKSAARPVAITGWIKNCSGIGENWWMSRLASGSSWILRSGQGVFVWASMTGRIGILLQLGGL